MSELISNLFSDLGNYYQSVIGWINTNLVTLQTISVVVSIVFLYGIIYSIIKSKLLYQKLDDWLDYLSVKSLPKIQSIRSWTSIIKQVNKPDPKEWGKAIVDADKILEEILRLAGFKGSNLSEVLDSMNSAQLANLEEIKQAHDLRLQIDNNAEFELNRETVVKVINTYRKAFLDLGLLE